MLLGHVIAIGVATTVSRMPCPPRTSARRRPLTPLAAAAACVCFALVSCRRRWLLDAHDRQTRKVGARLRGKPSVQEAALLHIALDWVISYATPYMADIRICR
jgi:hypothetical protein